MRFFALLALCSAFVSCAYEGYYPNKIEDPWVDDYDHDGTKDSDDNCLGIWNFEQIDSNDDGIGDACDDFTDTDGDGVVDLYDNCKLVQNMLQRNTDGDAFGDDCDTCPEIPELPYPVDSDEDGVQDGCDNCPFDQNLDQADDDNDGIGNVCDRHPGMLG